MCMCHSYSVLCITLLISKSQRVLSYCSDNLEIPWLGVWKTMRYVCTNRVCLLCCQWLLHLCSSLLIKAFFFFPIRDQHQLLTILLITGLFHHLIKVIQRTPPFTRKQATYLLHIHDLLCKTVLIWWHFKQLCTNK